MKTILILAALLCLSACVTQQAQTEAQRAQLVQQGYPPAYVDGYLDGFDSYGEKITKNVARYLAEPEYKTGWDDGLVRGREHSKAVMRAIMGPRY